MSCLPSPRVVGMVDNLAGGHALLAALSRRDVVVSKLHLEAPGGLSVHAVGGRQDPATYRNLDLHLVSFIRDFHRPPLIWELPDSLHRRGPWKIGQSKGGYDLNFIV